MNSVAGNLAFLEQFSQNFWETAIKFSLLVKPNTFIAKEHYTRAISVNPFYSSAPFETCPYSELFWSMFSPIRTEWGEIIRIFPYSVSMRENTDQNNSEYGHFLWSAGLFLWTPKTSENRYF